MNLSRDYGWVVPACSFLTGANVSYQVACTRASAVRDEEAAGSNPATPTTLNVMI